jgi:DNA repair protein RadC
VSILYQNETRMKVSNREPTRVCARRLGNGEVRIISVLEQASVPAPAINHAKVAVRYWHRHVTKAPWFDSEREVAVVLSLNVKQRVLSYSLVSIGTVNQAFVHPRDVFRPAIAQNACAVLLMHNHPSGDPLPSVLDGECTRRVHEAARCLHMSFLDHVIVGADRHFFSFAGAKALESGHVARRRRQRQRF